MLRTHPELRSTARDILGTALINLAAELDRRAPHFAAPPRPSPRADAPAAPEMVIDLVPDEDDELTSNE